MLKQEEILPADLVFKLKAKLEGNEISLIWDIKDNSYLYLDKFSFFSNFQGKYLSFSAPKGEILEDEYFGKVEVFFNQVEVSIQLDSPLPSEIIVIYQGCNQIGYCYTPIKKFVSIHKNLSLSIN